MIPSPPFSTPVGSFFYLNAFFTIMQKTAFAVIPCYNEGDILRRTIEELLALDVCGVIVVDDGSASPIYPLIRDLPVHCLRHCINLGQGAALQTGMDYAKKLGAEAVVHFDADGQHRPQDVPRFLEALQDCDIVIGSRFLRDEDKKAVPFGKRMLLRAARFVNYVFTGLWLSDAHNGYRALGRKALDCIELTENRMAHATEIMAQIKKNKLRVKELPVSIDYTAYSKAKGQRWYNSLNILLDLIISKIF